MAVLDLSAYKPVPATLGDANQIANGFQAIQACINALDQNNFAAGKIFDPAKLMQDAATDGQVLYWDNTAGIWKPGRKIIDLTVTGSVLASFDTNTILGAALPTTYRNLKLFFSGKSDQAGLVNLLCRVNNLSAANYYWQDTYGQAATSNPSEGVAQQEWRVGYLPRSAGLITDVELTFSDYNGAGFSIPKVRSHYAALLDNGTGSLRAGVTAGAYNGNILPMTRFALIPGAGNFQIGTRFLLIGD